MKLFTEVDVKQSQVTIGPEDRIMVLGSCFADSMGRRMEHCGLNVCVNPFGTLYNPLSILSAIDRLESGKVFTEADCVKMGAGSELICSFSHHTSFARPTERDFIENANARLVEASSFWKTCNKVIITLGTSYCYEHDGLVVSNCLKLPAGEFRRFALGPKEILDALEKICSSDREFIFTVSPIRHMADGAHANQISKASLLLSIDELSSRRQISYFPAYEIMMDELRDYRFYADDLAHPSTMAEQLIWERFVRFAVPEQFHTSLAAAEKEWRRSQHKPLH